MEGTERPDPALSLLFVCTANLCRSPFMELWARHVLGDHTSVSVASVGTHARDGEVVSAEMAAPLHRHGIDTSGFRSRRVTRADVAAADLVLTAEQRHRRLLLDDHPDAFGRILTLGQAAGAATSLPAGVVGRDALEALARRRPSAEGLDVRDPYQQGVAAAEACATTVTSLLAALLPVLTGGPVPLPDPVDPTAPET